MVKHLKLDAVEYVQLQSTEGDSVGLTGHMMAYAMSLVAS